MNRPWIPCPTRIEGRFRWVVFEQGVALASACGAALALTLSACTTTTVSDETDALSKSATTLKAGTPSQEPTASAAAAKAVLIERLTTGGPSNLMANCGGDANSWRNSIIDAKTPKEEDAAYKALASVGTCPTVPSGLAAPPEDPSKKALDALNGYLDGLLAIVAAKDSNTVITAAMTLSTSVDQLATASKAPEPAQAASDFFAKLAGLALAQAQYDALRDAVSKADPVISAAAPDLVRALRIEQARQIAEVTADAKTAAAAVDGTLNSQSVRSDADRRLALYDRLSPILDQLTAAQNASRVDPASNVRAVVTAHHKLAKVLASNKGETKTVITNVEDLAGAAKGVLAQAAK